MNCNKRELAIYLAIIVFLILVNQGCGLKIQRGKETSPVNVTNLKKVIIMDEVWGSVTIDDKISLRNIEFFKTKFKHSNIKPSNLIMDMAIKAQFVYENEKTQIFFTNDWAYDGRNVYEGSSVKSIYSILTKELFSGKQLSDLVQHSASITLMAKDINRVYRVNSKKELAEAILTSSQLSGYSEQETLLTQPQYPLYQINLKLPNKKDIVITELSPELFRIADRQRIMAFSNDKSLWEYCVKMLGKPNPDRHMLSYLMEADSVICQEWGGEFAAQKLNIVRVLMEGKVSQQKLANFKKCYEVVFTVKNEKIKVLVSDNDFIFNGVNYHLPGVKSKLEKVISAG